MKSKAHKTQYSKKVCIRHPEVYIHVHCIVVKQHTFLFSVPSVTVAVFAANVATNCPAHRYSAHKTTHFVQLTCSLTYMK
jgi:hypothetical protein